MEKFKCAICGKEYEDVEARINCEITCLHQRKEAEIKKKELELQAAQDNRKAEVDLAYENFLELKDAYVKDYGVYTYSSCRSNINDYTHTMKMFKDFWSDFI